MKRRVKVMETEIVNVTVNEKACKGNGNGNEEKKLHPPEILL